MTIIADISPLSPQTFDQQPSQTDLQTTAYPEPFKSCHDLLRWVAPEARLVVHLAMNPASCRADRLF